MRSPAEFAGDSVPARRIKFIWTFSWLAPVKIPCAYARRRPCSRASCGVRVTPYSRGAPRKSPARRIGAAAGAPRGASRRSLTGDPPFSICEDARRRRRVGLGRCTRGAPTEAAWASRAMITAASAVGMPGGGCPPCCCALASSARSASKKAARGVVGGGGGCAVRGGCATRVRHPQTRAAPAARRELAHGHGPRVRVLDARHLERALGQELVQDAARRGPDVERERALRQIEPDRVVAYDALGAVHAHQDHRGLAPAGDARLQCELLGGLGGIRDHAVLARGAVGAHRVRARLGPSWGNGRSTAAEAMNSREASAIGRAAAVTTEGSGGERLSPPPGRVRCVSAESVTRAGDDRRLRWRARWSGTRPPTRGS